MSNYKQWWKIIFHPLPKKKKKKLIHIWWIIPMILSLKTHQKLLHIRNHCSAALELQRKETQTWCRRWTGWKQHVWKMKKCIISVKILSKYQNHQFSISSCSIMYIIVNSRLCHKSLLLYWMAVKFVKENFFIVTTGEFPTSLWWNFVRLRFLHWQDLFCGLVRYKLY